MAAHPDFLGASYWGEDVNTVVGRAPTRSIERAEAFVDGGRPHEFWGVSTADAAGMEMGGTHAVVRDAPGSWPAVADPPWAAAPPSSWPVPSAAAAASQPSQPPRPHTVTTVTHHDDPSRALWPDWPADEGWERLGNGVLPEGLFPSHHADGVDDPGAPLKGKLEKLVGCGSHKHSPRPSAPPLDPAGFCAC